MKSLNKIIDDIDDPAVAHACSESKDRIYKTYLMFCKMINDDSENKDLNI